MQSRDFCYWLQGFFEITDIGRGDMVTQITSAQAHVIKQHLALVFKHEIDPSMGPPEHQAVLNKIHNIQQESKEQQPKTLADLIPKEKVKSGFPSYNNEQYNNRPDNWQSDWVFDNYNGWHPPQEGLMRC